MDSDNLVPSSPPPDPGAAEREDVDRLLAALEEASIGRYPILSSASWSFITLGSALALGVFSLCSVQSVPLGVFFILAAIGIGLFISLKFSPSGTQKKILLELMKHQDKRIIGPLILARNWPDMWDHQEEFRSALIGLLPQLQASDTGILNEPHLAMLNNELATRDMDYVVAILKALENLGTDRSIPYVEQLIKPHAWNITDQNIHEAAKECLAALMLRRESGRRGDGLLRAAAMNPEENLLRPIKHRPEGEVDQLLHPAPEPPGSTPDENQPDANQ